MSDFQTQLATLLKEATGEPPHQLSVAAISRQVERRRRTVAVPLAVAALVIVVAAAGAVGQAHRHYGAAQIRSVNASAPSLTSGPSAPRLTAGDFYGLGLTYPAAWHHVASQSGLARGEGPGNIFDYLINQTPTQQCFPHGIDGVTSYRCGPPATRMSTGGVLVSIGNRIGANSRANTTIDGKPALVTRTTKPEGCPVGAVAQTSLQLEVSPGVKMWLVACFGPDSVTEQHQVDDMLATATYVGPK
jgi:hypothetical protein